MNDFLTNTARLQEIMDLEIHAMQSLIQILEQEQLVLVNNEAEKLESITPIKSQLLAKLVELEKNRASTLSQLGVNNDAAGIHGLFSDSRINSQLKESWHQLLKVSADAQEQNRTNGLLINRQLNKNQATLNVLQSGNSHQAGSMYGADGQSKLKPSTGRGIVAG
ncbi:flagellar protein FlgN [Undibacterium seohonense]|jgi:flagella synthesis protein FlgN|uniref:Flagellar protein FlgN n=1 Tax=Undibacterium seohonense TaxID=1344950 RepID=A0ABR6X7W9_9BURK|nr:flagellar protein FlgN [Undibacterium seohonense]MBC3808675.1 flagellar protein FlgN [Undibacterium seohonense]